MTKMFVEHPLAKPVGLIIIEEQWVTQETILFDKLNRVHIKIVKTCKFVFTYCVFVRSTRTLLGLLYNSINLVQRMEIG